MRADTIIHRARLGLHASELRSLAVLGGRLVRIGRADEVDELRGAGTEVIDAAGVQLLPAITDSHTHFKRASVLMAHFIDFDALDPVSVDEVLAAVEGRVADTVAGGWVQGDSLGFQRLAEGRFPTRDELDRVSGEVPVVLRGVGRHMLAANSAALAIAGIDASTPDPPGGRLERDPDGRPNGILHEAGQLRLDANAADTVVPAVSHRQRLEALREGIALLNRMGIAAVHEIPREPEQVADWLELREAGHLDVRVRFYIRGLAARTKLGHLLGLGLRGGFGDEWARIGGVKFSIDGSATLRNAMVYEPYPGEPETRGIQRLDTDEFRDAVRAAHEANFQVAVHAIGQRAVHMALGAFEAVAATDPTVTERRHRIEHAYLPEPGGQLERMQRLGLVLSTQPSFIEAVGDAWSTVFQDEALHGCVPIASALARGIHVQINSDFPCSALNPFVGMKAAVDRRTREGRILGAEEAIGVEQAFELMTTAAAYTAFEEGWRGRIAEGHAADLIAVDRDPLKVPVEELPEVVVGATMVGGRLVHNTVW